VNVEHYEKIVQNFLPFGCHNVCVAIIAVVPIWCVSVGTRQINKFVAEINDVLVYFLFLCHKIILTHEVVLRVVGLNNTVCALTDDVYLFLGVTNLLEVV
jgi:hypothetical protein